MEPRFVIEVKYHNTICPSSLVSNFHILFPRSSYPFDVVLSYYIKWVTTSWTYSSILTAHEWTKHPGHMLVCSVLFFFVLKQPVKKVLYLKAIGIKTTPHTTSHRNRILLDIYSYSRLSTF